MRENSNLGSSVTILKQGELTTPKQITTCGGILHRQRVNLSKCGSLMCFVLIRYHQNAYFELSIPALLKYIKIFK